MRLSIRTKLIFLLFALISLSIALISNRAYKIALKDMENNAKFTTRLHARDISSLLEERLDNIKEKTLFVLINESLKSSASSIIFDRSPEILAVARYFVNDTMNGQDLAELLINPKYIDNGSINQDNLSELNKAVNFEQTIKENEYLTVEKLKNYDSDVIVYAFPTKITGTEELQVFVAVLIPDLIVTALSSTGGKYINYMVNDQGRVLAHPDTTQINKNISGLSIFDKFFDSMVQRERTSEYMDENGKKVVGSIFKIKKSNIVIVSKILSSDAYYEAEKLRIILIATSLLVFIVSLIIALFFAKTLIDPLLNLSKVTGEIARGNFLVEVDVKSKDEIGDLAKSFKKMGQELYDRENELQNTQAALIQSEKMSALGQIGAGIAHEVKNPLTGILGHAQLAREKVSKSCDPVEVDRSLEIIEKETARCKNIIENLMKFSRQEKAVLSENEIDKVVKNAIALVEHQLNIGGVKVIQEIDENIPKVVINANQIEQVLINLMLNAMHAMEEKEVRNLTVRAKASENGFAKVEVEDTGIGMTPAVRNKIFEPFFTTKPSGKGTGLGLSVSYGIIKSHKGILNVVSKEGVGTNFIIELPYVTTYPDLASESAKEAQNQQKEQAVKDVLIGQEIKTNKPLPEAPKPTEPPAYKGAEPILLKPETKSIPTPPRFSNKKDMQVKRPSRRSPK